MERPFLLREDAVAQNPNGAGEISGRSTPGTLLLDRAADFGEYSVGVRPDQPDCANHDHQNHRQHHGVFSDILAGFVFPNVANELRHGLLPFF